MLSPPHPSSLFFFNDTATTEIYTLSLHDALPISFFHLKLTFVVPLVWYIWKCRNCMNVLIINRSEEHTSELQSHLNLVCRLLLEKKKKKNNSQTEYIIC